MPLYEYACGSCGLRFERILKFSDPPVTTCPECGGAVEKLISSPAFHLKGSGWYITDYARAGQKDGGKEAAGKDSGKEAGKEATAKDSAAQGSSDKGASDAGSATTSPSTDSSTSTKTEAPRSESSAPAKPAASDSKK